MIITRERIKSGRKLVFDLIWKLNYMAFEVSPATEDWRTSPLYRVKEEKTESKSNIAICLLYVAEKDIYRELINLETN